MAIHPVAVGTFHQSLRDSWQPIKTLQRYLIITVNHRGGCTKWSPGSGKFRAKVSMMLTAEQMTGFFIFSQLNADKQEKQS